MIRKLFKSSLVYVTARAMVGVIGIIMLTPLLTRLFTPSQFGAIEIIMAISSLLMSVLMFGLDSAITRYNFESSDVRNQKRYFTTGLLFLLLELSLATIALLFLSGVISKFTFGSSQYSQTLKISFGFVFFSVLFNYLLQILRIKFKAVAFAVLSILNIALVFGVVFIVPHYHQIDIADILWAYFGAALISLLAALAINRKVFGTEISATYLKRMLKFGIPLISSGIFLWTISLIDRFFLAKYTNLHDVGLYSIGAKITLTVSLVITGFLLTWEPYAYSISKKIKAQYTYATIMTYYFIATFAIAVTVNYLSKPLVLLLATPEYLPVVDIIGVLLTGTIASGAFIIATIGVNIVKKTHFVTIATLTAAIVKILLNLYLIPKYNIMGAAVSTLLAYAVGIAVIFLIGQKHYHIPYENKRLWFVILFGCLLMSTYYLFDNTGILQGILLAVAALAVFTGFVWVFVFNGYEKKFISNYLLRYIHLHR